jgi:hypothetical protein
VRRPLTLMNSAPRSVTDMGRLARKENAGAWPASGKEDDFDWLNDWTAGVFGEGTTPQDRLVS